MPLEKVLIVEDEPVVRSLLQEIFTRRKFSVTLAENLAQAEAVTHKESFDLVMLDIRLPDGDGHNFLERLATLPEHPLVVMVTGYGTIESAVACMRAGAFDYLVKPFRPSQIDILIKRGQSYRQLEQVNQLLSDNSEDILLVGRSPIMQRLRQLIERVAPTDATVLITGENGTGKGVVAQALHAVSVRAAKAFISVNMGGLPEGVFESELFGHVRGAFTDAKTDRAGRFELADGGTLFLDEIGNIPLGQQAKILRVLETGELERVGSSRTYRANVRLISATNSDLPTEVASGNFRQDLLFRLNTIQIHLPPLRERREDIALLGQHFLKQHVERYRKAITGFDEGAIEAMKNYAWPGNVRELDHSVERGVLMSQGKVVRAIDLGLNAAQATPRLEDMSLEEVEAFLIKKTLARCDGNARKAAEELGLSRSAFYRRLERYKL